MAITTCDNETLLNILVWPFIDSIYWAMLSFRHPFPVISQATVAGIFRGKVVFVLHNPRRALGLCTIQTTLPLKMPGTVAHNPKAKISLALNIHTFNFSILIFLDTGIHIYSIVKTWFLKTDKASRVCKALEHVFLILQPPMTARCGFTGYCASFMKNYSNYFCINDL